jgi:hypothetical protein
MNFPERYGPWAHPVRTTHDLIRKIQICADPGCVPEIPLETIVADLRRIGGEGLAVTAMS